MQPDNRPDPIPSRRARWLRGAIESVPILAGAGFLLAAIHSSTAAADPPAPPVAATSTRVIAWNDLGMHCMDPGYSVFALLPPFNDFKSALIVNGKLQKAGNPYQVSYRGTASATGQLNTSSIGKTDFWDHVQSIFGVALPPDHGLAGHDMPGPLNTPQPMSFDGTWNWFAADGVPITPYDDTTKANNTYPLLEAIAKDANGTTIASTSNVVPVSDEMDCSHCHASAASPYAKPLKGWVFASNTIEDYRLNILRLHDEKQAGNAAFASALAAKGMNPLGLEATVTQDGHPMLCAACHASNALPGSGIAGISRLTSALHLKHANVVDTTGKTLDSDTNRSACYECHPGSVTRCLRGAMGSAVAKDGTLEMQCQNCHGSMSKVGDPARLGWLDEPSCQQCHTGTATQNSGQIRFTSVYDANGNPHVPANLTFATDANVPATGFDLYRFSDGHGSLQCEACHGSTHAEYPSSEPKDNQQSIAAQGHTGMLVECQSCHGTVPFTVNGGPHGMHSIGQSWVNQHGDIAETQGTSQCRTCHGTDYRGTVLSYAQDNRTFSTVFGTKSFFNGAQVGCFHCHNGPGSADPINNAAPVVTNKNVATPNDTTLTVNLAGTDANNDPLTYRIVEQPSHGTVGIAGAVATYFPEPGFVGTTTFTFAAWDNKTNSNLGTVTVTSNGPSCLGASKRYGFGCAGTGGVLPQLDVTGCPTPGSTITVALTKGLPGATSIVFVGAGQGATTLPAGCVLRVFPLLPFSFAIPLSSGVGGGAFSLPVTIPPATTGTATLQAFVVDPGVWQGFSATNGVQVDIH